MAESSEAESAATQLVSRIGNQLATYKTCPNKDTLGKLLKQAASALPDLKQSEALKLSIKPLSDSLIKHGLLQHKDKDIRLLVGICFCEIIRVLAPNPDFSDAVFTEIFKLVVSIFAELDDTTSPFFSKRVKLLETVAKLQFYLLMLDTGCDDLVIKMFKSFFSIVRENHPQSLISAMSSIMTRILEEKVEETESGTLISEGKFSEPLVDVILHNLLKEAKGTESVLSSAMHPSLNQHISSTNWGASSASTRLAVSVIQNCGEKLEQFICMFLRSCIVNRDSVTSEFKEFHHEIILQVFRCAPQMLLSVIPNLTHELLTDQVDVRIKALNLIRKLFAMPGHHVAQEYQHLFIEFLNRFSDKSAEVRMIALSCAKAFYMNNPSGTESLEVLAALEARLLDFDDRVRTEAVTVVCDLSKANMKSIPFELISKVIERLRDKKVFVRKRALQKLLELYQEYCIKCAGGIITLSDQYEQIPCKIFILCYDKELKDFRPQNLESVLAENLFPTSLPIDERTKHWIFMSSHFTSAHLKALKLILSHKRRLQNEMKAYLGFRNKEKGKGSEEVILKIRSSFVKMSAYFPDPAKAEECFHRLNAMKDNGVFNALVELLNEGGSEGAQIARDNLLTKIGERDPLFQFLQLLSMKCMFNIFCYEHVSSIIDHISDKGFGEKHYKDSSTRLFLIIISTFPLLLRGSKKKFQLLLLEEVIPFSDELLQILVKEGPNLPLKLSDIYSSLERLCLEGTRAQAKLAVSAIAALVGSSEQFIFSKLLKTLVHSLHVGHNVPTVLQTLGCVAQYNVSAFEVHEKEVTQYIVDEIFLSTDEDMSNDRDSIDENFDCSCSCNLKIYGLRALVRSFLPHQRATITRPINHLLDIILEMLQKGEYCDGTVTSSDKIHIRLAAAKSILRLSRRWDLHISPQIFHFTILVAKDHSWVRELFLSKIDKLLKDHAIPSRYACAFSITASDSPGDMHDNSWKYMERFIKEYGKATQIQHNSPAAVTDYPLYIIVYLIYVLAHDSNFPSVNSQNEGDLAQFLSPLVFGLRALVNPSFVDGDMDLINNAVLYLRSIFHAIKLADDCVDEQMTPRLHILAEVGMSILNALTCSSLSMSHSPGLILLPSSIYKANVHSSPNPPLDEIFIKKLIRRFRPQISQTASLFTKQRLQNHPESLPTDIVEHSKMPSGSRKKVDLLIYAMNEHGNEKELHRPLNQEANISGRRTHAASSTTSDELSVAQEHKQDAYGNCDASIKSKQLSSSSNPSTKKILLAEKEDVSSSSLKEKDVITRCNSITTGASESLGAKHMNSHILNGTHDTGEALVGQHIKLWSPTHKCYYFCTIDGFDSTNSTHKITYDCGKAAVVSLDSEEWEISSSTLDKDLSSLQSSYCDPEEHTSISHQRKMADEHEFGKAQENLSKEEEKVQRRPLAANTKRRKKVVADTSASGVTNINENAISRRTRRKA